MTPDDYLAAWSNHAIACQELLLAAAINLATDAGEPDVPAGAELCTAEELEAELARRTNALPYQELHSEIAQRASDLDPTVQRDDLKNLAREAGERVAALGKPLAPAAVEAVLRFVERWQGLSRTELLERYGEIGAEEAAACLMLMSTKHRRIGVNAVLSKHPAERVAVFG